MIEDIQIGTVFSYYGPRRFPFGRRGLAVGRILGLDAEIGVVHVRTYRPSEGDEDLELEIGHLPILFSSLERSIHSTYGVQAFDPDSLEFVLAWRERHARDEVGAFNKPLWEAKRTAWEAVPERSSVDTNIESAFPKRNAEGAFTIVEVVCVPRA